MEVLIWLMCFLVFSILQAVFINGVKISMEEGMILEDVAKRIKKALGEFWSKPVVGCIKCMASFYSIITYWPAVLCYFGFEWWQVPVFVANVFVLVQINFWIYKRT